MAEHTIKATFGVDTKPAKDALSDIEQHANRSAKGLTSLFALEPLGVRRGAGALSQFARGITDITDETGSAIGSVTAFGRALSTGLAGGAIIASAGILAQKFVDINKEASDTAQSLESIRTRGLTTATFEPLSEMHQTLADSAQAVTKLRSELAGFGGESGLGKAWGSLSATVNAAFRGMKPSELRAELQQEITEQQKTQADVIDKIAAKTYATNSIDETRFRIGEREAAVLAENIRHNETLNALSKEGAGLDRQHQEVIQGLLREENRRHNEAVSEDEITNRMRLRDLSLQTASAQTQARIADIQSRFLPTERASLAIAQERVNAAQRELVAAQQQVEEAKNLGTEQKIQAQTRLSRAETAVREAGTGAGQAVGGALEQEFGEEALGPTGWQKQYEQRQEQYRLAQRVAQRQGLDPRRVRRPVYRAAEYQPFADIEAAAATPPGSGLLLREELQEPFAQQTAVIPGEDIATYQQRIADARAKQAADTTTAWNQQASDEGSNRARAEGILNSSEYYQRLASEEIPKGVFMDLAPWVSRIRAVGAGRAVRDDDPLKSDAWMRHQMDTMIFPGQTPQSRRRALRGDELELGHPSLLDSIVNPPLRVTPQASKQPSSDRAITASEMENIMSRYWS